MFIFEPIYLIITLRRGLLSCWWIHPSYETMYRHGGGKRKTSRQTHEHEHSQPYYVVRLRFVCRIARRTVRLVYRRRNRRQCCSVLLLQVWPSVTNITCWVLEVISCSNNLCGVTYRWMEVTESDTGLVFKSSLLSLLLPALYFTCHFTSLYLNQRWISL